MSATSPSSARSRRRNALYFAGYLAFLAVAFLGAAEAISRMRGWRPWVKPVLAVRVEPGGRYFRTDPRLGFVHLPGSFTVTLGDGYSFRVTHLADGHRITRPPGTPPGSGPRPEIWIFGCSYTHGWSLDDDETYPWLVQASLPDFEVVNFGSDAYGATHALLQLQDALAARPSPAAAVFACASFHDDRNTFALSRRRAMASLNRLGMVTHPYARFDRRGRLRFGVAPVEFRGVPFLGVSAFANLLENTVEAVDARMLRSSQVSSALIAAMADLSRGRAVPFVVAGIHRDDATLALIRDGERHGAIGVDISVDLALPGMSNQPHDPHPSALANRAYAGRLTECLETTVLGGRLPR
jgi:hypothetical protein